MLERRACKGVERIDPRAGWLEGFFICGRLVQDEVAHSEKCAVDDCNA